MLIEEAKGRISEKSLQNALFLEFRNNYGLSPAASLSLLSLLFEKYFPQPSSYPSTPGKVLKKVVSSEEPAGKPLSECKKVDVWLTLFSEEEDLKACSSFELKKIRIKRITQEAYSQGGLLTVEELAFILGWDESSVKRAIKSLRGKGAFIPTRGSRKDIGRGRSHKSIILEKILSGMPPTRVAFFTHHCLHSVERYIKDFLKVVHCWKRGLSLSEIPSLTGLSLKLTREYLALIEKFKDKITFSWYLGAWLLKLKKTVKEKEK